MNNSGSPESHHHPARQGRERHGNHHGEHERRGRRRRHSQSSPDTSDEAQMPFCPYQIGNKEWKKWAKTVKKTAHVHRRAAETYAKHATGLGTTETNAPAAGAESAPTGENQPRPRPGFDFTQAASQIQEFLNAVGKFYIS